ncbi:hypothetical protein M0R45_025689 [Rubus argutus]|uniref:Uncharacterized protein n=1 Tax=Rubus argutus TaxID=59490 RepID=A0AAW1WXP0_RUBAR
MHNRSPKQEVEELEAYRASFGFSADEIITTTQYVETTDAMDDSFTMTSFGSHKSPLEESIEPKSAIAGYSDLLVLSNGYEGELFSLVLKMLLDHNYTTVHCFSKQVGGEKINFDF